MTSSAMSECRVVIDTLLFVPAMASAECEARVYTLLLRKCCKVVVSQEITEQYHKVMNDFGYPGDVIFHELTRLQTMNKLRKSARDSDGLPEELAPRKDRHIVAPCLDGSVKYLISSDRGILARRDAILTQTGTRVLDLQEAEREFNKRGDCRADNAGDR
jgi:predicted nucleic acid-binding protein